MASSTPTGLKKRAGVEDLTDEEIAAAADEGETLLILPARTWREVYPVAVELLEATEADAIAGAMVWLEMWLDHRSLVYEIPCT
jgi:hypothetical protein